ncbi:hypothetical protein EJ110_NYTH49827 [Nymphaea thermarum]|nr:hypothetical protein EJ110_NYTH49827 [Nymphaea thermarum]
MVHLFMGERRGLNPRVVDSQSTALIHLATSAPTPAQNDDEREVERVASRLVVFRNEGEAKAFHKWKLPGKASNKEVGLFIDLTSLYLRLKIRAGRAVIKALATCNCLRERHVTSKALRFASASSKYELFGMIGLVGNMPKALECHPARAMNWREDHQKIMHCSTHHLLGCHRPGENQYEAVASPSIELHHHISDDRIRKSRIKKRNGWKSFSDGAGTAVD